MSQAARGAASFVKSVAHLQDARYDMQRAATKVQAEYRRRGLEFSPESCRKRVARQVYIHDVLPCEAAEAMVDGIIAHDQAKKGIGNLYPE